MAVAQANQRAEKTAVERLRRGLRMCQTKLEKFRTERVRMLEAFVGAHYGAVTSQRLPMNVLAGAVLSLVPNLISGRPRAYCDGKTPEARQRAALLAHDLDQWAKDDGFEEVLRLVVLDAMFGPGLFWVGLGQGGERLSVGDLFGDAASEGEIDTGKVVAERVSLDDYVIDPLAKRRSAAQFEGHIAELDFGMIQDSPLYANKEYLRPDGGPELLDRTDRAEYLSREKTMIRENLVDVVRVYELYLPRGFDGRAGKPLLLTLPLEDQGDLPLRIEPYDGPEGGPYVELTYHEVPDNAFGLAPAMVYYDLHAEINRYARKMFRHIDREKILLLYERAVAGEDAAEIRGASDGDVLGVKDVKAFQEVRMGGAGTERTAMLNALLDFFSQQAGNSDLIAGTDETAPTLGQTQILVGNTQVRIEAMRQAVKRAAKAVYEKVAFYRYHDPLHDVTLLHRPEGFDDDIRVDWNPEERAEAEFGDYDVDIEAQSFRPPTPEQAAEKLINAARLGVEFGVQLDGEALIRRVAQLTNVDEINDLLTGATPMPAEPASLGTGLPAPPRPAVMGRVVNRGARMLAAPEPMRAEGRHGERSPTQGAGPGAATEATTPGRT